jgi:glucose/arabinose dehydrogenase
MVAKVSARLGFAALFAALLSGCGDPPVGQVADGPGLRAELVADDLDLPLQVVSAPSDPRLFIVEQTGRVLVYEPDSGLRDEPFLDLSDRVSCCGERGLLSLAFHPHYATNGFAFATFSDGDGATRVERFTVSADPNALSPASAKLVIVVDQPYANHNGGLSVFGPDGMLYVGLGDGGSGGDPQGHGQNLGTLLGSMLRLDVDTEQPYEIPPDNPFVGRAGAREEIWAYGLRNPWRFSFDSESGELYIADVGQNLWEEVNRVPAGEGGHNYGWNVMEGSRCYNAQSCSQVGLTLPVYEYDHGEGCSITGGYVYRGTAIPSVIGHYFFADFCGGWVRSLRPGAGTPQVVGWDLGDLGQITSFGEDAAGELYVVTDRGRVYRLEAE